MVLYGSKAVIKINGQVVAFAKEVSMKKKAAKKPTLASLKRTVTLQLLTIKQWENNTMAAQAECNDLRKKLELSEKNVKHLISRFTEEQNKSCQLSDSLESSKVRIQELLAKLYSIQEARLINRIKKLFS